MFARGVIAVSNPRRSGFPGHNSFSILVPLVGRSVGLRRLAYDIESLTVSITTNTTTMTITTYSAIKIRTA